ncbi:unnamed protein product [Ceutorhynchus assimilis]|uniref:Membrane protein BRI3 n=1 Tax=Ceutorhynchus assimilis TaxID=467358 RepID=A0A9N9MF75_9CUCU|nr:unnamed protein product [Ceutorhynchus assimilis]
MENKEFPPAYSDEPPIPLASGIQNVYASPSSPTFEPPYMSAPQQPQQQQPQPQVTRVTVVPGGENFIPGSCPVCRNTSWTGTYSCFAWFLCLFCFWNFGLCCCLCMRKKKCTQCGFALN